MKNYATYLEPCQRNSPEFNKCIRNALQLLMGKLSKTGIPELELETLDPLKIAELIMTYDGGDIAGKVTLLDTYTRGFSAVKIIDVRSKTDDPNFFGMEIDFYVPRVVTNGIYKMDGRIAKFPINGKGIYNITATEVTGTWNLIGSPVTKDGEKFMRIDRLSVRPEVGNLKVHASNLINDNPELSQVALAFVNRFWKVLYQEMLPYAEESFDKILRQLVNKVFLKIPYDQLFPPAQTPSVV
ncbi:protein takeout-like isoform X2 [Lycorma delicatula]|uniref:protein takeout-like isoform X2 n=1 Tax=Lycorma delicatula TaxID=130591 RepID=UPI003F516906